MVVIGLPDWFSDEEEGLKRAVYGIAERQNINYSLVLDSRSINNAIQNILNSLVRIQENARPEFDKKSFDSLRKLNELVKKSGEEEETRSKKSLEWTFEKRKKLSETMKKIWAKRRAERKGNLDKKNAVKLRKLKKCEICGKKIEVKAARKYCYKCAREKRMERQKEFYHKKKAKKEAERKDKHNYYLKNKGKSKKKKRRRK